MDDPEFYNKLLKFDTFLIAQDAWSFWSYVHQDNLKTMSHPTYWITHSFNWAKTTERYAYWDRINNLWDEIANK